MARTLSCNFYVIAAFLNQNLPEARNPRDSLWFKGNKLYSYQSHLATIMSNGTLFINFELIGYSNTTSRHIASLRHTAGIKTEVFTIPLDLKPIEVLNWYWNQIEVLISKYLRARSHKDTHKAAIKATLSTIEQYVDCMELDRTSPEYIHKHTLTKQLFKHQIL